MPDSAATRYFNRELSWLEFNQRVLDEARDASNPLLERLKFLAISGSNLDEFFMVRVGGLQILRQEGVTRPDPAGMTPAAQLRSIIEGVKEIQRQQYACLMDDLLPSLAEQGIRRIVAEDMTEEQMDSLREIFLNEIYPIFSPMVVSLNQDFPLVVNQTLNACVRIAGSERTDGKDRFAIIPFGRSSERFLTMRSEGGYSFVLLEDAVRLFADQFFPGETVLECTHFRITRNGDIAVSDDTASDLLADMQELLEARKTSDCVRLEIPGSISNETRTFLQHALAVEDEFVLAAQGPLALRDFMKLGDLEGFGQLRYEPWQGQPSPQIDPAESMFETLSREDVVLCHPYESFDPVVRLIEEAAQDPDVLAIKQTLYRTSRRSAIVAALAQAAKRGKYVTVLVELKARFDEARNIEWARSLEQQGVQVIYGVRGLKTHAKLCLIVRREPRGIQRYVHFGTGNYNEVTARVYSDVSLLTADEELGADATSFFNAVTGYSQPQQLRKLEAAPIGLRERLLEMIRAETRRKQQGQKAAIVAKMNSLVDPAIIDALYEASQAGVPVRLNVRGICCLRPGVPGLSENICVVSIVGRLLEHARILYFYHGGDERVFISSADFMPRNLDRRVELLVPVEARAARQRLVGILETYFDDNQKSRRILPDGGSEKITPGSAPPCSSQQRLHQQACEVLRSSSQRQATMFEPLRAQQKS